MMNFRFTSIMGAATLFSYRRRSRHHRPPLLPPTKVRPHHRPPLTWRPADHGSPENAPHSSFHPGLLSLTIMATKFVSNRNESVRIFKSDLLESVSHIHPITPVVIFVPIIGYFLYQAVENGLGYFTIAALLGVGLLSWTLVEYVLHRFVFHFQPRSSWGQRLHFILHGVHHDYPRDSTRLVMPPAVSLPLGVPFYFLFHGLFGTWAPAAFAGLLTGYLCYDMIHYATHHFPMRNRVGRWLKRNHLKHHYTQPGRAYGVTTPLWDFVFGTRPE